MVALYGKVEPSRSTKNLKMIQPQFEILPDDHDDEQSRLLEVGRITPVYESLGGSRFASRWIRRTIYDLLQELKGRIIETPPESLFARLKLPGREEALCNVHFPPAGTPMTHLQTWSTSAHRRLIFEELFYLELGLESKRRRRGKRIGISFETNAKVREAVRKVLPFHPTAAQRRALGEIVADMRGTSPMRRLLQGDVGSGKTIVALQATIVAIENGYQAALMAPTEILATQHYLSMRKLLDGNISPSTNRPYRISLLTGSLEKDRKRTIRSKISRGEIDLVVGTQALLQEKVKDTVDEDADIEVRFAKLGLLVIDEQHRFGVLQRFHLMKKAKDAEPDVLVMTATPIPRTLALSLYGDLDLSVLDELPPGRTPIITRQTSDERADEVWDFLRKQVAKGHQAYVVYPVIEGAKDDQPELDFPSDAGEAQDAELSTNVKKPAKKSAKAQSLFGEQPPSKTKSRNAPDLKSATEMYESLRHGPLAGLRLGLLHGRLSADEKEVTMRRFQRGEIDVLVATTVIEVGVDVPNATVMVIEHAERFGLAQLHQLRGRVGRGAAKSYCILMTGGKRSAQGEERLAAMVRTQNGFELAELDLQLRGPGEFFGTRQAGLPDFRVANLLRDRELLELAKEESARFVQNADAEATAEEKLRVWARLKEAWQRRYGLVEAG
jgi:ATP-dependent DNA helicase RecG